MVCASVKQHVAANGQAQVVAREEKPASGKYRANIVTVSSSATWTDSNLLVNPILNIQEQHKENEYN